MLVSKIHSEEQKMKQWQIVIHGSETTKRNVGFVHSDAFLRTEGISCLQHFDF